MAGPRMIRPQPAQSRRLGCQPSGMAPRRRSPCWESRLTGRRTMSPDEIRRIVEIWETSPCSAPPIPPTRTQVGLGGDLVLASADQSAPVAVPGGAGAALEHCARGGLRSRSPCWQDGGLRHGSGGCGADTSHLGQRRRSRAHVPEQADDASSVWSPSDAGSARPRRTGVQDADVVSRSQARPVIPTRTNSFYSLVRSGCIPSTIS